MRQPEQNPHYQIPFRNFQLFAFKPSWLRNLEEAQILSRRERYDWRALLLFFFGEREEKHDKRNKSLGRIHGNIWRRN
jgi:hypothetical protein